MTRKRMMDKVNEKLDSQAISPSPEVEAAISTAVDCALQYVLDYNSQMSEQLISNELYTQAMAVGGISRKIKSLIYEPAVLE